MFCIDRQMFGEHRCHAVSEADRIAFEHDPHTVEWEKVCHNPRLTYWISANGPGRVLRYEVRECRILETVGRFKTLAAAVRRAEELEQERRWDALRRWWNQRRSTVDEF